MQRTISVSEIKPYGNLKDILNKLLAKVEVCEKEGYTKSVSRLIRLIIEFGFNDGEFWFEDPEALPKTEESLKETEMIVMLGNIMIIRLNTIAQKHLNNIDMDPIEKQLGENLVMKKYFPDVIFVK
jgi:hypothetical protein